MKLGVSEVFYSVQGEGGQAGLPMIFIRLQGCKTKHACFKAGIICDTEFESGEDMTLEELKNLITSIAPNCKNILWTGGEPLDQLTNEVFNYFRTSYRQSIETSGLRKMETGTRALIDYLTISPKVAEHVVEKNFAHVNIDEFRYVRHKGQTIPKPSLKADRLYISPHSDGFTINSENLKHCIELVKQNPDWSISVQQHKLWNVL